MIGQLVEALHLRDALEPWAILDLLILWAVIYQLLLLIRGTRAVQILLGLTLLAFLHLLTGPGLIPLPALHQSLGSLLLYIPFLIIVLFQTQIRQALARVGRGPLSALLPRARHENLPEEIALAAVSLASKRVGALIVIERELGLRAFYETGIRLEAVLSYDLLMNIFTKGSPLHDGAVILADGRIKAASCFLPLTTRARVSRTCGTRHRAAIGISEESDALAIIVSEERGVVSIAEDGILIEDLNAQQLVERLREVLAPGGENGERSATRAGTVVGREHA